jgi:hypothetical protein
MTLPRPGAIHRWQGRMLVDRSGQTVGSIETIYLDKATEQPEWALLEASTARSGPTFVPLVSASEEGDSVRVPFDKTLVERTPSVPAGRELSKDQEEELYRHYGVPYSRAESPSGLPAAELLPASEPPLSAGTRITDPRVGAAAAAALAVAARVWRREAIGRQISTAISRLGTIPGTFSRRRRRRRRAEAINQAVTGTTERATALAWGMARVLVGAALLPVAGAVQGGRRTWAGVQAAQQAVRQGGKRLRPGPRRRRRRGAFRMVLGGAAGYVLGARAGEQGYQEITQIAKRLKERPELERVGERAVAKLDQLSGQAADKLQQARQSIRSEASSSGNQPITAAPDTPPEPPS